MSLPSNIKQLSGQVAAMIEKLEKRQTGGRRRKRSTRKGRRVTRRRRAGTRRTRH